MNRILSALILVTTLAAHSPAHAAGPIQVMLLDGESAGTYHNWQVTTPVLKQELEETGLFRVDVVTAPGPGGDTGAFHPEFTKYQVIVMNYDAPDERWSDAVKSDFEAYVQGGGGVAVVHASDNAFPGWPAFNQMIGIGGWRNRTEKAGPLWYFKDGKLTSDDKPGHAGNHGNRVPFAVTVQDSDHPITKGLPHIWMHQGDELYNSLRGPGQNMTVLATAYSDPANHGSGHDEPMLMALNYGKGRIFHTAMGHDINALSCVGFIVTLQRGTEWAATGKVTQKIPAEFPSATVVAYRNDIAAMDQNYKYGLNALGNPQGPARGGAQLRVPVPATPPVAPAAPGRGGPGVPQN